jgi:transcriptional regulator with XRE-family HTH domain
MRLRREQLNLTLVDLAYKINISWQQVQKYEKGINHVSFSRLIIISRALDTTWDFFLFGIEEVIGTTSAQREVPDPFNEFGALRGAPEIARAYIQMAPEYRAVFVDVAQIIARKGDTES